MEKFVAEWLRSNGSLEVVPEGTCLLKSFGNSNLVVEQKPTVRSLSWASSYGNGIFRLALPYVVFVVWFDGIKANAFQMRFAKKPLESLQSEVYAPFLPNLTAYSFCMGDVNWVSQKKTLVANTNHLIERVWGSTFNNDQNEAMRMQAQNEHFTSLKNWERESKKNPLFILKTKWHTGSLR